MKRNKDYSTDVAAAASQFTKEKEYWVKKLSGDPVKSTFPYDFAQSVKTSGRMEREAVKIRFPNELFSKLLWISNRSDTRLLMILAAGLVLLLNRYTGDKDITVGMPIYKQHFEGDFINTVLALRCQLTDQMTFKELLYLVKQTIDDAIKNQNYPLKALFYELKLPYSEEDFPLFDITVMLKNIQDQTYIRHIHTNMGFSFLRTDQYLEGIVEYNPTLYLEETVESIAAHYILLLERALADVNEQVSRVDLLSGEERKKLLVDFNQTDKDHSLGKTLHGLFEDQVEKTPDRIAVIGGSPGVGTGFMASVTSRELNEQSNRLAKILKQKGICPGCITALLMESSLDMVVAILAILKAGGAYLPIDPDYPQDRINFMLTDSSARVLVKQVSGDTEVIDLVKIIGHISPIGPITHESPTQPCYIIYTSGTTGKPKGVMVEHRSVVNTLVCRKSQYDLDKRAVCLQLFSHAFDGFVTAFFTPLISGAPVVLMNHQDIKDVEKINAAIARHRVTHFISVPALYRAIIETITPEQAASLEVVTLAGDKVIPELLAITAQNIPGIEIAIEYGVTEAAVMSTIKRHQDRDDTLVIGQPIWNTRLYILNEMCQLQPIGVPGELCISGAGVSRGYLNNPELTAEKYIEFNRSYRSNRSYISYHTGDLVRWLSDGNIQFLGRTDYQVKIRGFRVELGEIENRLLAHGAVKEAVVLARQDRDGSSRLAAYVVPDETRAFTVKQLLRMEKQGLMADFRCGELPNGMPVFYLNRNETDYMYRENIEEQSYLKEVKLVLGNGACIFDVGASIGTFSLLLHRQYRQQCKDMVFYLFEPIPLVCQLLRLNTTLYGIDARVFEHGLAAREEEVEFTYFPYVSILSAHFPRKDEELDRLRTVIRSRHLSESREEAVIDSLLEDRLATESFTCLTKTLSQVIQENGVERIDLLKVDIGKYGKEVLKGIDEADWPKVRQIVIEVEDIEGSLEWVGDLLKAKGYGISVSRDSDREIPALYRIYAAAGNLDRSGALGVENVSRELLSISGMISELQQYTEETLPGYMVPSSILILDELPLTSTGKVDRKALPDPEAVETNDAYVPPQNQVEEKLAEIWAYVLGKEKEHIGRNTNFFEAGGHSLSATIMAAHVHKELQVKLPLAEIFKKPTIRGLAEHLKGKLKETYAAIEPVKEKEYYALSPAQRRLYFLQQMDLTSTAYNMAQAVLLEEEMEKGEIEKAKLENTFRKLISRHESLRTSFGIIGDEPVQKIHESEDVEFPIDYYDAESLEYMQEIIKNFERSFDLSKAPLLRAAVIKTIEKKHLLLVDMHHIITDGRSRDILIKEFKALYEGRYLPPLRLQYKDYAEWLKHPQQQALMKQQETYWVTLFSDELPVLALPVDYPRPIMQSFEGSCVRFAIEGERVRQLRKITADADATVYMSLLAVFNILLSKLSGQEDIIVGTPIAARRHADLEPIIGMFVNTLPMRNYPVGHFTFQGFLKEVKERTLTAYENQEYPFEELVDKLSLQRDISRNPMFDVMFVLQSQDEYLKSDLDKHTGVPANPYEIEHAIAKFDMTLIGIEVKGEEELFFDLEYCTKLFKKETIERFVDYFKNILSAVITVPQQKLEDIEITTDEEKKQLLYDFNDTEAAYARDRTIHELFAEQSQRTPDGIAVHGTYKTYMTYITYNQLDEKSNQLAHLLREKGVGPGSIAAIMVERSLEMIIGIFAILKAGGAYLPIDPAYPRERIDFMLKDSNAGVLLKSEIRSTKHDATLRSSPLRSMRTNTNNQNGGVTSIVLNFEHLNFEFVSNFEFRASNLSSSNLAYLIYTSGSTGTPKGVMIEHHSVVNRLHWMQEAYSIGSSDMILQKTPIVFDVSVWELFWWSLYGAGLCLLGPGDEKDPRAIVEAVGDFGVTTMHFVPSMLNAFLSYIESTGEEEKEAALNKLKSLRQVFSSGEALGVAQVNWFYKLFKPLDSIKLINLYGPTEATVDVSYFNCSPEDELESVPIGKPIHNTQLYVLNNNLHLRPIGVTGQLYISGVQLARGYLNNPELTNSKFQFPNYHFQIKDESEKGDDLAPHSSFIIHHSSLLYKTGDLARWLPDGSIQFLGRMDDQVKVRGFRIELGEIEKQLTTSGYLPIKEAVVTAGPEPGGDNRLIAYVVADETSAYTIFRQLEDKEQGLANGLSLYQWPNGMVVYYLNRGETDFMYHEIFEERSYMKHGITLPEGACIFDIGANIGVFSLFALRNCKNARIYAFEPLPPAHRLLALNTSLYKGHCQTFECGIGSVEGEVDFTYYPHAALLSGRFADSDREAATVKAFMRMQEQLETADDNSEPFVLTEEQYDELLAERLTFTTYTCPMKTLSQVMNENKVEAIDLLKIDVEKAEMEVLEGIRQEHWPRIRQLVIEVHESEDRLHRIVQLLEGNGYRVVVEQEQLLEQTRLYNLYAKRESLQEKEEQEQEKADSETPAWYSVDGLVRDTRDYLKNKLPDYMVPAHIVPLTRLPLTPNGKVDRKALPEPEIRPGTQYVEPQSDNEREIAKVWKKVLGLEKVGINDNFFDVGGNSLKIINISAELKRLLGIDIPVVKMFQYPTIASLARYIAKADHTEISQEKEKEREEAVGVENIKSRLKQRRKRSRL
jgi:amino acid adenylation domain-containing protein/FkbM family methyltransferase